ncbi:MAG: hypothetical protein ACXAB2_14775 [Candidatus Hodarchaeales archaeon]|jgi:hypothetical protein
MTLKVKSYRLGCIQLILSFFFGLLIWFFWSLYRSERSQEIKWINPPKILIAIMTVIVSFFSISEAFSCMDIIGTIRYIPLRLSFNQDLFYGGGWWLVGFITSEPGFSLIEPNSLEPKSPIPIFLIIGVLFFLLNYIVTILLLEFLSKRVVKDVDMARTV